MHCFVKSVDAFTHQGFKSVDKLNHYNEDRFVVGNYVFAVIDGATALTAFDMDGLNTSAYTAKFLFDFFHANDVADDKTAMDLLIEANNSFRNHLEQEWPDVFKLEKLGPCAGVSVIKMNTQGRLSMANLADCLVVAKHNNTWNVISQISERLEELDGQLQDLMFHKIEQGKSVIDVWQDLEVIALVKKNRLLQNIEYGTFNAAIEAQDFIYSSEIDLENLEAIALFSDGLFWPEAKNNKDSFCTTAQKMYDLGVVGYYQQLKKLKDSDPEFKRFRRLKHMDDATGLMISIRDYSV